MIFDKSWENLIYKVGKQFNEYPFDWVVASTKIYIKRPENKKVLDIGCGTGNHVNFFLDCKFKEIHGFDGSKTATEYAKNKFKKCKKVIISQQEFNNLKYKNNYFDLCLDRGSLTHNTKDGMQKVVNDLYFFLKPGGYFFSVLFNSKHYAFKKNKKNSLAFANWTKTKKGTTTAFYSKNELKKIFKKFKFVSIVEELKKDHKRNQRVAAMWQIILKK